MAEPDKGQPQVERLRDLDVVIRELGERLRTAEGYLRLDELVERHAELEKLTADPDLWVDQDRARAITGEYGKIHEDIENLAAIRNRIEEQAGLVELASAEPDGDESAGDLVAEIESESISIGAALDQLELRSLLGGPYDESDVVAEIHAGVGGTDAQDWAEMMLRMYLRWAERRGFTVELDEVTPGQEAGILSATFIVRGRFAYGLLASERGVHRLVRISPFDANHRRQTSFAAFGAVPFIEEDSEEVPIDDKELRIDTYRSSGAGGQHVNVTDSAVRITHLPTGIVVSCQNERSQHQNKARAMQILAAKLAERQRAERQAERDALAGPRQEVAWGNQIRSYVLAPFQLVKDLRTQHETGNVDAVLDGDLDGFIEAFLRWQRSRSQS